MEGMYSSFTYMSKCVKHENRGAYCNMELYVNVQENSGVFGTHMYTYEWVGLGTWFILLKNKILV